MCGIDTYPKNVGGWEGKASKQASRATPATQLQQCNSSNATPAKAHDNAPADLPGPPHQILGKWWHWLDFNFA